MTKTFKIWLILAISILLVTFVAIFLLTNTKNQPINSWWQAGLAALTIIGGALGMLTAKKWSWLKSEVGKGVFFLSTGLLLWGVAQIVWAYALISKDATAPLNDQLNVLSYFYFIILPLIIYGMVQLSGATGAKYLFKKPIIKVLIAVSSFVLVAVTCYTLVAIAGGTSYFTDNSFWRIVYYLGFPVMDAIALAIAVAIVALSWRQLGGKFRLPIISLAIGFVFLYIADFAFSYFDGKSLYYNGHWSAVLFIFPVAIFSIALCSLDPTTKTKATK